MGEKMKTHDKKIYVGLFGLVLFVLIGYILACPEMLETAAVLAWQCAGIKERNHLHECIA